MPALFKNNASALLASSLSTTDTTVVVSAGLGNSFPLPSGGSYFYGTLFDDVGNYEIVKCTARVTDTLTVVRAQDGTNPTEFVAGNGFALRPVAAVMNNFVQLDGAQTITGLKTFSGGLSGNLAGNVTGDLTGDVTGNLTGNVTGDLTGNADTATQADNATTANSIANSGGWNINFNSTDVAVFTAGISTVTMTVSAVTSGTIVPGQIISGTGVTANTRIISQTNATGATTVATHTFAAEGTIGQNRIILDSLSSIRVGQFITGTGIPANTTVSSISYGYPLYIEVSNNLTGQAAGDYNFYDIGGIGIYEVSTLQTVSGGTTITASNKKVNFVYNGVTVATIDSGGNFNTAGSFQGSTSI